MFRQVIGGLMLLLVLLIIGSLMLEQFPQLQPLFEEFKSHVVNLYNMSIVKYGMITTLFIIFGLFILFGSSRRG